MGLKAVANLGGGGGGGGTVTGSGTPGTLAKFTGAGTSIGDSLLSESGTTITSAATAETFTNNQAWTIPVTTVGLAINGSKFVFDGNGLLGVNVPTTPGTCLHVADGGGPFAGSLYEGVRLQRATEALFSASDYTRSLRAGLTGGTAVVGTSTAHDLLLQRGNVTAATLTSGAIATLTLTAGGAYTNGTYPQQPLTGGTGSGATADIVVAGGTVTSTTLRSPGTGYTAADALSCVTIGAGAGLIITVAAISQVVEGSGNVTALGRIGAGTATPRAPLDAIGGALFDGAALLPYYNTAISNPSRAFSSAAIGTAGSTAIAPSGNTQYIGININPLLDTTASTSSGIRGVVAGLIMSTSPAGYTGTTAGFQVAAYRREAGDLATAPAINGFQSTLGAGPGVGSVTTGAVRTLQGFIISGVGGLPGVAHTITSATHLDLNWTATGDITTATGLNCNPIAGAGTVATFYGVRIQASTAPVITNRWGISQEDTLASNQFSAVTNTFSGIVRATGSTAGAPAFSTPADTDTGLYFPSANTVRISTNGTVGLEVDSSQNLSFNSGFGSAAVAYGCRAWVNFDGITAGTFAGGASTVTRIAASTTATVTTTTAHGLVTGNRVYPTSGVAPNASPSAGYIVTVLTSTTFTITTVATTALVAVVITFAGQLIRGSGNVSSIADLGVGLYGINFITAMPDINYAWSGQKQQVATNTSAMYDTFTVIAGLTALPLRTASVLSICCYDGGAQADSPNVNISVFR